MGKRLWFIAGLAAVGIFAYCSSYYFYLGSERERGISDPPVSQYVLPLPEETVSSDEEEYYIAKIEEDVIVIRRMPDNVRYETIKLSSVRFLDDEEERLKEGILFESLSEVFEFLENSMS